MEALRSSSETVVDTIKKTLKFDKGYDSVSGSEADQSEYQLLDEKRRAMATKRRPIWKPLLISLGLSLVLATLLGVIGHQHSKLIKVSNLPAVPTGRELGDCGTEETAESARAAGCKFDPMSWIVSFCQALCSEKKANTL
jgi:hypothetical protein